jgi:hypothetical protein
VSKQRRIIAAIGKEASQSMGNASKIFKYKTCFMHDQTGQIVISSDNWIDVLRQHTSEQLVLYMRSEAENLPKIEISNFSASGDENDSDSNEKVFVTGNGANKRKVPFDTSRAIDTSRARQTPAMSSSPPSHRSSSRGLSPQSAAGGSCRRSSRQICAAFFTWPAEEGMCRDATCSPKPRIQECMDEVLWAICQSDLPRRNPTVGLCTSFTLLPEIQAGPAMTMPPIKPSTRKQVQRGFDRDIESLTSTQPKSPSTLQVVDVRITQRPALIKHHTEKLLTVADRLLDLFVPQSYEHNRPADGENDTSKHDFVRFYWGIVENIIMVNHLIICTVTSSR